MVAMLVLASYTFGQIHCMVVYRYIRHDTDPPGSFHFGTEDVAPKPSHGIFGQEQYGDIHPASYFYSRRILQSSPLCMVGEPFIDSTYSLVSGCSASVLDFV